MGGQGKLSALSPLVSFSLKARTHTLTLSQVHTHRTHILSLSSSKTQQNFHIPTLQLLSLSLSIAHLLCVGLVLPFSTSPSFSNQNPSISRTMRFRATAARHLSCSCLFLLLSLPWLAMASPLANLLDVIKREPGHRYRQIGAITADPHLSSSFTRRILANGSTWNTLDGSPPVVIANGGSCGLFPDQTTAAYYLAASFSLPNIAVLCDVQLTKDAVGICRTGIDLGASTTINFTFPELVKEYAVNGVLTEGFFSIDITSTQAFNNLTATQVNQARSPDYDGQFSLMGPEDVAAFVNGTAALWLNVEYSNFFSQHKLSMPSYVLKLLSTTPVDYISSPEIAFLKSIKTGAPKNTPKLIFRFRGKDEIEPSTNVTYGSLLSNLTAIATYAVGIMVPKEYIWQVDNATNYLVTETKLVKEAHDAKLALYASGFVNDPISPIYNYSFDPVREYLQYVPTKGSNVDGFLTDFPSTASEAVACFRDTALASKSTGTKILVISHNGDSGDFPGCTLLAYDGAVQGGASHIDCPVQMTKDGVPICRESVNLLTNTDANTHSNLLSRLTSIPELQATKGLFSFNLTWEETQDLKALMFSPEDSYKIERNPAYTQESIMNLSQFLVFAKKASVGILVDVQNGYFLETEVGLDVVGEIIRNLNAAGLNGSDRVVIQSEDSAVLRRFQQLTNYTLIYKVTSTNLVVTKTEVAQIKDLANYVTLPRGLVQVANAGYLMNKTDIVDLFHAQNVSVFVHYLRNEFVALPYDYESDPSLEINTLVQIYQVDGLITDFPATASSYLSNGCLNLKTEAGGFQYSMRSVIPGDLVTNIPPNIPPPPPPASAHLNVSNGETSLPPTFAPQGSPTTNPNLVTPTTSNPTPSPSAVFHWLVPSNILVLSITIAITIYNL